MTEATENVVLMTEATENLVLEHLRHIRGDIGVLRVEVREVRDRLATVESQLIGLRRDLTETMASVALLNGRIDRLADRMERVEQRLGLVDV